MFGTRGIKNFIGSRMGYGSCPNCGDSWQWKTSSSLSYTDVEIVRKVISNERIATGMINAQKGIMLCAECISNPETLDLIKIRKDLEKTEGWGKEEIDLVIDSVKKYKNKCKVKLEQ